MWSVTLEPGKTFVTSVDYTFNLSMAILNLQTVKKKKDVYTIYIETEDIPCSILCHLSEALHLLQVKLDLVFPPGTTFKLFTSGAAQIQMTGYLHFHEENNQLCLNYNLGNEIINQGKETTVSKRLQIEDGRKRKAVDNVPTNTKSVKLNEFNQSDEDSDDDEVVDQLREDQSNNLLDDKAVDKPVMTIIGKPHNFPLENNPLAPSTSNFNQSLTNDSTRTIDIFKYEDTNESNTSLTGLKNNRKHKDNEKLIELSNGVKIQELKIGDGATVEPGKYVTVYYISRFKSSGQVFDSMQDGPGLSFLFQRGQVVKSWDIGIAGMKVGGIRKIVCPLKMGYAVKGIHWKTLLEFEVELLYTGDEQKITPQDQEMAILPHRLYDANQLLSTSSTETSSKEKNGPLIAFSGLMTFTQNVEPNKQLIDLIGGVKIQELLEGNGAIVKPGKNVNIYYTGRIKSSGQVFDLMNFGVGLSFVFQRGEVIKGLDIGIAGMKVGGRRIIVCPPEMCRSTEKMKLSDKPKGTLEFEVELLRVD